jgi:exodeoxyribonuclease III
MTKLMTWNIQHGGGSRRMPEIALSLVEEGPDVVVITEYRTTTGGQLRGILADHGWEHQACTDPAPRQNGILIASRWPLEGGQAPSSESRRWHDPPRGNAARRVERTPSHQAPVDTGGWWHRQTPWNGGRYGLEVWIPALGFGLAGVHIPCSGSENPRTGVWKELLDLARSRAEEPFVILGDFNTGRHMLDEEGATFRQTALLGRLSVMGYVDAWRALHPEAREYSWFSHAGAGFRIDHAFLSRPLSGRLRSAWYAHEQRARRVSDHASMTVGLD